MATGIAISGHSCYHWMDWHLFQAQSPAIFSQALQLVFTTDPPWKAGLPKGKTICHPYSFLALAYQERHRETFIAIIINTFSCILQHLFYRSWSLYHVNNLFTCPALYGESQFLFAGMFILSVRKYAYFLLFTILNRTKLELKKKCRHVCEVCPTLL